MSGPALAPPVHLGEKARPSPVTVQSEPSSAKVSDAAKGGSRHDADAGETGDSSRGADGGDAQPEPEPEEGAVSLAKGNKGLFDFLDKTNEAYKFPYWAPDARKDVIGKPEPLGQVRAARDTSTLPDLLLQYVRLICKML